MNQNIVLSGKCSICAWMPCIFCFCWVACSINVDYILLVDSLVQFFCILADFLLVVLSIAESRVFESDISIVISTFFWLTFTWSFFSHSFAFNLLIWLYLKWVSCSHHVIGSCYLFILAISVLIGDLEHLHLR